MSNALKEFLIDRPHEYWVEGPQEAGYKAYQDAGEKYGGAGEWSKADAAKHMAWQSELASRTMLPPALAIPVANVIGAGKEVLVDGLGSAVNYVTGRGDNPIPTWKNSLMDMWNNYVGAGSGLSPEQAVELAGRSTNSIREAIMNRLPYSGK